MATKRQGKRHDSRSGRSYETPIGLCWSVTTVIGILDKSGPLTYWAARCATEYIYNKVHGLADLYKKNSIKLETLDPILEEARKEFKNVKDEAADIGNQVHEIIEKWCKSNIGKVPEYSLELPEGIDPRVVNGVNLFLQWAKEVEFEPLHSELFVYHPKYEYAGTTDIIAKGRFDKRWKKKRTYLIDIKTSKGIYETYLMQDAAYVEAFRVDGKIVIEGEGVIRVGKEDAKPEWHDATADHMLNFDRFIAAKNLFVLMKGRPS